jgi:hypothetical protein
MKSRIALFAALVGTMLLAGCGRCCKKAKSETTNTENVLGSLGSTTRTTEASKENLELPAAAETETAAN